MIIGLGNPEKHYTNTRHNTGFMALEWLAEKHGATWQAKNKLKSEQASCEINGAAVLLVKPAANYNNSGMSVRAARDFYSVATDDILIIHDELALPLGTIRTRLSGSDAGNNGIKNIISHIGPDFKRIRIGIGQEERREPDMDFVLSQFNKTEAGKLPELFSQTEKIVSDFIGDSFEPSSIKI